MPQINRKSDVRLEILQCFEAPWAVSGRFPSARKELRLLELRDQCRIAATPATYVPGVRSRERSTICPMGEAIYKMHQPDRARFRTAGGLDRHGNLVYSLAAAMIATIACTTRLKRPMVTKR